MRLAGTCPRRLRTPRLKDTGTRGATRRKNSASGILRRDLISDRHPSTSVSASHSIIELGPEKRAEIGDTVTCFDWQTGSRPEDVAESCKSSVYDLTMHLNPLLPRRVV